MADEWIKMRCDLTTDPAVIQVATATGLDEYGVVGRLQALWSWASMHLTDGYAVGVTRRWLDRHVQCDGFASALAHAGWLEEAASGIRFPKWDTHNSDSAKKRALSVRRMRKKRWSDAVRDAGCDAASVTDVTPTVTQSASQPSPSLSQSSVTNQESESEKKNSSLPENNGDADVTQRASHPKRQSWLTPYDEDWQERFGSPIPIGEALKSLAQLRMKHGGDAGVRPVWQFYLRTKDPEFASPTDFAKRFFHWRERMAGGGVAAGPKTAAEKTAEASRELMRRAEERERAQAAGGTA